MATYLLTTKGFLCSLGNLGESIYNPLLTISNQSYLLGRAPYYQLWGKFNWSNLLYMVMIYSFHVYMWPISLLKSMDRCIRNFIWSGNTYKRKLVTVAWQKLCSPVSSGGLGLRFLRSINEAAMLKLSWVKVSSSSHWSMLLKSRFSRFNRPLGHYANSSTYSGRAC